MIFLNWIGIVYFILFLSYMLNILITEMPLDNRYKKLKRSFSFSLLFGCLYRPFSYWFDRSFKEGSRMLKIRHICVFLLTIFLFFMHVMGYTLLNPFIHFVVFSILIICFFTDAKHQIIPNEMSFGLIFVGMVYSVFRGVFLDSFMGMMLVIIIFSLITIIMFIFGQSNAFGAGDIKLCLGIGAVWGWQVTAIALYFTFLIGGIVGFYFLVIKKKKKDSYYPFAPVIIMGLIVALIYTDNIFDYYYPWINNSFQIENLHLKL